MMWGNLYNLPALFFLHLISLGNLNPFPCSCTLWVPLLLWLILLKHLQSLLFFILYICSPFSNRFWVLSLFYYWHFSSCNFLLRCSINSSAFVATFVVSEKSCFIFSCNSFSFCISQLEFCLHSHILKILFLLFHSSDFLRSLSLDA